MNYEHFPPHRSTIIPNPNNHLSSKFNLRTGPCSFYRRPTLFSTAWYGKSDLVFSSPQLKVGPGQLKGLDTGFEVESEPLMFPAQDSPPDVPHVLQEALAHGRAHSLGLILRSPIRRPFSWGFL